jgi:hypothetical protein
MCNSEDEDPHARSFNEQIVVIGKSFVRSVNNSGSRGYFDLEQGSLDRLTFARFVDSGAHLASLAFGSGASGLRRSRARWYT